MPWNLVSSYLPFSLPPAYVAHFYGIIFTLFAMFYSVLGGMQSIVWGDVIKYCIMTVACVAVAVIAMGRLEGHTLNVPEGWSSPFFGWHLDMDWSKIIHEVNDKIKEDGFSVFGALFMMMLFKGVLASLAGPAPNYDMQKILSTRSPGEAAKMSGFVSIILLPIRYSMVIGFTVLGLLYYDQLNLKGVDGAGHSFVDFERILPSAINSFLPAGVLGLVLTGLLGAFMGTFAGTLNAGQAYIVNDIYLKYINPNATLKRVIGMNYLAAIVVVTLGIVIGLYAKSVNDMLQWIVGGLYGGYIASNVLKWHWWRFNASGYFWGMMAGIVSALLLPLAMDKLPDVFTEKLPLFYFPLLLLIALGGSVAGTLLTAPTDVEVLKQFYKTVRPWGFWSPIHRLVVADDPSFTGNGNFKLDAFNVVIGIVAQLCLTILPMYFVLGMRLPLLVTVGILGVCVLVLKRTWWDRLELGN